MHEMKAEREALETKGREIIEKRDELKAEEQKGKSMDIQPLWNVKSTSFPSILGNEALQHYRDSLSKLEKDENKFKSDR